MSNFLIWIIFLLFIKINAQAQDLECVTPLKINTNIFEYGTLIQNKGVKLDIFKGDTSYQFLNAKCIWLEFQVEKDSLLTFDIIPANPKEDYDFHLYKYSDTIFCSKLLNRTMIPVRSCYSQNLSENSFTGLSSNAVEQFVPSGFGPGYCKAIITKRGERFILNISIPEDYKGGEGFKICFYGKCLPQSYVLENIQFQLNNAELLASSYTELNKLVQLLNKNKSMTIEVGGHTDNTGNESYNKSLSEARAKAVAEYLSSKNIDKKRISYKGYGSSKPIASNKTENGKSINRRVEFIVLTQ